MADTVFTPSAGSHCMISKQHLCRHRTSH